MGTFLALLSDESGQGLVEYVLIVVLVSFAAFLSLKALGSKTTGTLLAPSANIFPG